jgi:cell division control protein 11
MEDIEHYNIPIYNFPYDVEEDDEDTIEENSELRVRKTCYCINRCTYIAVLPPGPLAICYYW